MVLIHQDGSHTKRLHLASVANRFYGVKLAVMVTVTILEHLLGGDNVVDFSTREDK